MRLSHIIEQVYFKPWCITPSAWSAIDRLIDSKLAASPETVAAAIRSAEFALESDDAAAPADGILSIANGIATIRISGVIGRRIGPIEKACSDCTDVIDISNALDKATHDTSVSEIILDIDSPGGSVTGVPELAEKIAAINQRIVTVNARTSGMICSAAYWLASGCETITATQTSDIGSIGVYNAFCDLSAMYAKEGAKMEVFKAGKYKGQGIEGTSLSDEFKAMMQAEVEQIYAWFTSFVRVQRAGRGAAVADETMQGQSFMGEAALACGLIDAIEQYQPAV